MPARAAVGLAREGTEPLPYVWGGLTPRTRYDSWNTIGSGWNRSVIQRIELHNFMSHADSVLELAGGLTVLVGPNNSGKSAVVEALRILCSNDRSQYAVRHGELECSVVVETDDGHRVEWRRRRDSVSYSIDGEEFDRLGGRVPEELHRVLRLPSVDAEGNRFDLHFGDQKAPIFLLDRPASHAAQFFASSSDANKLVEMQGLHRQKTSAACGASMSRIRASAARLS